MSEDTNIDLISLYLQGVPNPGIPAEVLGGMCHAGSWTSKEKAKAIDLILSRNPLTICSKSAHLRLLTRHDTHLWTEFVNSCSPRSLRLRFLSDFCATPERADSFCNVDPDEEVAVAAETMEGNRKRLIGIARLVKCRCGDEAEYAVIVTDRWQRKTLGRRLTEVCVRIAKHIDVRVVNAETLRENVPMTTVLSRCRFKVTGKERNMVLMSLRLEDLNS